MRLTATLVTWAALTLSGSLCAQEAPAQEAPAQGEVTVQGEAAEAQAAAQTNTPAQPLAATDAVDKETTSSTIEEGATVSERARQLGHAGLSAYGEKEFTTALDQFQKAEALAHSPVFQLYVARCLLRLGREDEARPLLTAIAVEEQPTGAPDAWKRARTDAADELSSLDSTRNAEDVAAPRTKPEALDLSPSTQSATVSSTPPVATPPTADTATSDLPKHRLHRYQWGAIAAYSAGGAGLIFGSVFGGLAIARANNVKENCDGTSCLPEDQPAAYEAIRFGNLATAGFVAAAVGAVAGTTLLLLPREQGKKSVWSLHYEGTAVRLMGRF